MKDVSMFSRLTARLRSQKQNKAWDVEYPLALPVWGVYFGTKRLFFGERKMAKVKLNPVLMEMRGQIGDLVFKRYEGRVIIGRKADLSEATPNEAQLEHQKLFRQAALYGKLVMADPAQKADYEAAAKARGKPIFSLAVADFFNAPSVDEVDLSAYGGAIGDEIVICAHDDFEVSSAQVSISYADGQPVESGDAVETPAKSGRWVYKATVVATAGADVRIAVTVEDRPGGQGQADAEKSL